MNATTQRPSRSREGRAAPATALHEQLFTRLDSSIAELWARARTGRLWQRVTSRGMDRALYRLIMAQLYLYTRHNSINQAVAALRAQPHELHLLRFVYDHAREELGHERMVLHDLGSCGLLEEGETIEEPLAATDALIGYLYGVALREGPVARLGYSYWAESAYEHIAPLLASTRESLGLGDRQMTFFTAHAAIDARHAVEVREAIRRSVTTQEQAADVHRVAVTSLWLTIQILEHAFAVSPAPGPATADDGRAP